MVVIDESGNRTDDIIMTEDYCTGDVCSYTFSSDDDITTSHSVEVEVIGCTTETYPTDDISSCKILYSRIMLLGLHLRYRFKISSSYSL